MIAVRCPVPGTYLVRDESQPIPYGQTESSYSVVVHRYRYGWVCERCGFRQGTILQECLHVKAARERSEK
jgi:hypothetical protein